MLNESSYFFENGKWKFGLPADRFYAGLLACPDSIDG